MHIDMVICAFPISKVFGEHATLFRRSCQRGSRQPPLLSKGRGCCSTFRQQSSVASRLSPPLVKRSFRCRGRHNRITHQKLVKKKYINIKLCEILNVISVHVLDQCA